MQRFPCKKIAAAEEIGDEPVDRLIVERARGAELNDAAPVHDCDLVRHRESLLLVVRDEAVRNAVGEDMALMVDFNQGLHLG